MNGALSIEHYYPYIKGTIISNYEEITIEKQTDKESYAGVCEDYRLGMTLIFYLQNIADYAKSKWLNYSNRHLSNVKLSALSINATILLGVHRDKRQKRFDADREHFEIIFWRRQKTAIRRQSKTLRLRRWIFTPQ